MSNPPLFNHYFVFPTVREIRNDTQEKYMCALSEIPSSSTPGERIRHEAPTLESLAFKVVQTHYLQLVSTNPYSINQAKPKIWLPELLFTFSPPSDRDVYVTDEYISKPKGILTSEEIDLFSREVQIRIRQQALQRPKI